MSLDNLIGKMFSPLLSFLPSAEKSYLSLDIGSSSVKMLEVSDSRDAIRILNAGFAALLSNSIMAPL
jgi:Tfp pilus assembly PilM family ATPase